MAEKPTESTDEAGAMAEPMTLLGLPLEVRYHVYEEALPTPGIHWINLKYPGVDLETLFRSRYLWSMEYVYPTAGGKPHPSSWRLGPGESPTHTAGTGGATWFGQQNASAYRLTRELRTKFPDIRAVTKRIFNGGDWMTFEISNPRRRDIPYKINFHIHVDDVVVFQLHSLRTPGTYLDPRLYAMGEKLRGRFKNLNFDNFALCSVFPEFAKLRHAAFDCSELISGNPPGLGTPGNTVVNEWLFLPVHFPDIMTVYLIDDTITLYQGRLPKPGTRRFEAAGSQYYEVDESDEAWNVSSPIFAWRAWVASMLVDPQDVYNVLENQPPRYAEWCDVLIYEANYVAGALPPLPENLRYPEFWDNPLIQAEMPPIRVKVLAAVTDEQAQRTLTDPPVPVSHSTAYFTYEDGPATKAATEVGFDA